MDLIADSDRILIKFPNMAEDESVDVMSLDGEIAERLGVSGAAHPAVKNDEKGRPAGRRSQSSSPTPTPHGVLYASRGKARVKAKTAWMSRASTSTVRVLADLKPFLHLLPDLSRVDINEQRELYKILFETGVKVYVHLQKFLAAFVLGPSSAAGQTSVPKPPEGAIHTVARLAALESEMENITMRDRLDQAFESLGEVGDKPLTSIPSNLNPDMIANTLGLFAAAALRRPPTRAVEVMMMASSQDSTGAHSDLDRHDGLEEDDSRCGANEDGILALACAVGYTDLVQAMVRVRGSTNFRGDVDCTPLMEACCAGTVDVVRSLIAFGADINVVSVTQNSALIYAAAAGQEECVRVLLATGKCNVEQRNENGHCALMETASAGHLSIAKRLIAAGAKSVFINMNSEFKESPLTLTAYKGHDEVVKYLLSLDHGNGPNRDEELHTALMEASMDGHVEVARLLLAAGAPVNLASESFESPLTLACCGGHDELVKILIDAGAHIEEPNDESYTPLMEAAREGHANVVKVLLEHGAQVNSVTDETVETALTVAACGGFTDVLDVLVQHGGDLEAGTNTPLMEAAQEGHVGTVMYILGVTKPENRSPKYRQNMNQALALAAENGHLDVVEILHSNGADLNYEYDGRTPLMKATKNGYNEVVMYLIRHGADLNYRSSNCDATALSLACSSGHKELAKHLLRSGADPTVELKDGATCILEAARNGFVELVELMLDHNGVFPQPPRPPLPAGEKGSPTVPPPPPPTPTPQSMAKTVTARRSKKCVGAQMGIPPCTPASSKNVSSTSMMTAAPPDPFTYVVPSYSAQSVNIQSSHYPGPVQLPTDDSTAPYAWLSGMFPGLEDGTTPPFPKASGTTKESADANFLIPTTEKEWQARIEAMHREMFTKPHLYLPFVASQKTSWPYPLAAMAADTQTPSSLTPPPLPPPPNLPMPSFKDLMVGPDGKQSPSAQQWGEYMRSRWNTVQNSFMENFGSSGAQQVSSFADVTQPQVVFPEETVCNDRIAAHISASSTSSTTELPSTQSVSAPSTPVPLSSSSLPPTCGNFLASTYESIKKNFAGLPLPTSATNTAPQLCQSRPMCRQEQLSSGITSDITRPSTTGDVGAHSCEFENTKKNLNAVCSEWMKNPCESTSTEVSAQCVHSPNLAATTQASTPNPCTLRRTHSEGDDIDTFRAQPSQRAAFNVDKATESNNDTPLTLACSNGHTQMVDVLVSRGANIEHRDKKGFTPLILAATGGHVGVVELLLNNDAQIEAQSERTKDTALSLACSGGRKEVVELLLKRGANKEHRNVSDYTPLSLAASGGYVEIVNMLLNAGAEINSRTGSKLGISPLMLAAMNGHKEATRLLLERGSDINAQIETNRNTALTLACFQGRTDVVRLLLQYHANVEHRAKTGLTPLMEAANGGYVEVGELLLDACADPNTAPVPSSRDTALTIAADKGHDKFVDMLVHRSAIIDAKNKKGCSALWLACHGGHIETVQTLVKHNADVDAQDNRKVSPVMIAFRKGHTKVVKYLVDHVKQFPGDSELSRYLATVSDADQLQNCKGCMDIIVKAKNAQAEQANKAAESLLALLAEEEEQARSKKQAKLRKKEKKKEAKKAKKVDTEKERSPIPAPPKLEVKEDTEDESEEESDSVSLKKELPAEREILIKDDRVPLVVTDESPSLPMTLEKPNGQSSRPKRTSNRRSRNESGKSTNGQGVLPSSTRILLSPISKTSLQTEEWVKASKKNKQASKTTKISSLSTAALAAAQKDYYLDDNGAYGGWKDVELSRRRSATLNVCSTVIARVIGRGGANINAIREATGASIEVEKQSVRRDQHDRQICIRGTQETVKNATQMINGLIADNEASVTDIIRQVLRGNTSVASSVSSESGSRLGSVCESKTTALTTPATPKGANQAAQSTPQTTNVWQQRMAARQQQQQNAPKDNSSPPPSLPVSSTTPPILSMPVFISSVPAPVETTPVTSRETTPAPPPTFIEDNLRKAPGYRPQVIQDFESKISSVVVPPDSPRQVKRLVSTSVPQELLENKPSVSTVSSYTPIDHPPALIGKQSSTDSVLTMAGAHDLTNIQFLDESTHAKLAEIWSNSGHQPTSQEPAWGSQLLLNNFSNLNIGNSTTDPEWKTPSSDAEFLVERCSPCKHTTVPHTNPVFSTGVEWSSPHMSTKNLPFYARSQPRVSSIISTVHPTGSIPPPSLPPHRTYSSTSQPESNVLYNQLAAQLLTQQGAVSSSPQPSQTPSYYPSPSYTDPAIIGMGHVNQTSQQMQKSYANSYQAASNEYESLNTLLNSSFNHHQPISEYNGTQASAYPSSPSVSRSIPSSRIQPSYAPPPGFGALPGSSHQPNIGANTTVPPPPVRPYYNTKLPQVPGIGPSSAFNLYGSMPNSWMPTTQSKQPGINGGLPQQMPWQGWN